MTNSFKTNLLFLGFVLSLSSIALTADQKNQTSDKEQNTPIQVHGDTVEYFHNEQKAVGTGHVSVDYEGAKLTADKITVLMATQEAIAEGNVTLVQDGSVFKGDRAEYNYRTKIGNVSKMDAEIAPSYYGKANRIEKVSDNHYRAVDSYVSTCCGDSPFYKIAAQQIDIHPNEKVEARNAVLYVQNIPILFIPYFVTYLVDFDRFPVQLVPGKNQEWGAFLLSKWRYHLVEGEKFTSRGNILADYREKRGVGGGIENFYHGDWSGHGAIRTYVTRDDQPALGTNPDRYRAQWRHQSKVGEATTLTTELNKISDATMIKDYFFREEYEKDAIPDNYVSLITAKPEYTFSVLARERLNDFQTVVERDPELRFDTHNRAFLDTPVYVRQEIQFTNLEKKFANSDGDLNVTRFDTNHTLSYAGHVGAVSVTPHIGTRQTYYSRDASGQQDIVRATFDGGVDMSTRFYNTYDFYVNAWGLDYNQIRHIFTPTASYSYRPNPTVARTTLQQFDSLDAIDKQNFIRFSFENKLQTKEHRGPDLLESREIARVIPFFDLDFDSERLENVGIDVELRPYSWLGLEADAVFDTRTRDFTSANFDVYLAKTPEFQVSVGQRYLQNESTQLTGQLRWIINTEWELKVYERYEFDLKENKEFEATVSKTFFDCIIVDFTYNHRDSGGDAFYFVFKLKAFPTASFGLSQSYNRPKASRGL